MFGMKESIDTAVRHYKEGNLNWPMIIYISLAHAAAIIGLFSLSQCHKYTLLWAFVLWPIRLVKVNMNRKERWKPNISNRCISSYISTCSGVGITGGVHRLWAHRSYKATYPLRLWLMLSNSIANQGSIWHWARDHRVHHKHSETDADPHNATRGFFFAHMGWLFIKKHPAIVEAGKKLNFDDLANDSLVVFQKQYDPWFALFMCFVFPGLVCTLWGDNFWNGYWVAGGLRYIMVLHFTWCVNSAAHLYGDHPYEPKIFSAENPLVSLGSLGEGWHNWHHKYPFDYAASEFGIEKQFNPTKLFIDVCVFLGLASDCKRATGAWSKLRVLREELIYGAGAEKEAVEVTQSAEAKKVL